MKYIIGIGNYSMGDDSVGLKIIEYIDENIPDRDFEVIDMSDNGLNLVAYLTPETERILFVDCVKMGKNPGETMVFSPDQVISDKALANISTHEGDMIKIIQLLEGLDYTMPPMRFFGIEPKSCESGLGELSDVLSQQLTRYVESIITLIGEEW
ncbi:hydrogenase maturation protease [Myxococcota bacterium]|nr:hydrogenase maturation protease [Myxococcota bacterium]MBU1534876.1 hydrogenase maturation protease [Myxococcota bacterium]